MSISINLNREEYIELFYQMHSSSAVLVVAILYG